MILSGLGWLPWRSALVIAALLLAVMLALRASGRYRQAAGTAGEAALILVLYAAWQYAGSLAKGSLDGAFDAGRWLARVEGMLGWPTEAMLQQPVLDHDWLIRAADTYYASLHTPVFVLTLVWVLVFRRNDWAFARTTVVLLTASCLLLQYKPVAPPRLIPEVGVIDTAALNGLSVYAAIPGANQFSAMPSVHIAWAGAVALIVIVAARTRWRWLVLAYPVATLWVVVVTGNHFILDGVVALLLLAASAGVALAMPSQRPERWSQPDRVTA